MDTWTHPGDDHTWQNWDQQYLYIPVRVGGHAATAAHLSTASCMDAVSITADMLVLICHDAKPFPPQPFPRINISPRVYPAGLSPSPGTSSSSPLLLTLAPPVPLPSFLFSLSQLRPALFAFLCSFACCLRRRAFSNIKLSGVRNNNEPTQSSLHQHYPAITKQAGWLEMPPKSRSWPRPTKSIPSVSQCHETRRYDLPFD